jgi:hypothetical protein
MRHFQGLDNRIRMRASGAGNANGVRVLVFHVREEMDSTHARQMNVGQDQINRGPCQRFQRFFTALEKLHVPLVAKIRQNSF